MSVLNIAIIFLAMAVFGCERPSRPKIEPTSNSPQRRIITDESIPVERREKAIEELQNKGDWKSLMAAAKEMSAPNQVLGETLAAVQRIGNPDAIHDLVALRETLKERALTQGQFNPGLLMAVLESAIETLQKKESDVGTRSTKP